MYLPLIGGWPGQPENESQDEWLSSRPMALHLVFRSSRHLLLPSTQNLSLGIVFNFRTTEEKFNIRTHK